MDTKYCSKCGAELIEGKKFCHKCGEPISDVESERETVPSQSKRKATYVLLGVLGALLLIILGAIAYTDYSEKRATKLAREKFVADSLEQARKDSIKLAEQKEKEKIEAEKLANFRKKMTFRNFLGMLDYYDKASFAQKCGLSLIYRDFEDGGEDGVDCLEIVYGYEVEKGNKTSFGYEIIPKSNHSCFFRYNLDSSTSASLNFKDEEDAQLFFNKAKEYGLINHEDTYFIPKKKLSKSQIITKEEFENSIYEMVEAVISTPYYNNGWYVISIGIDF